MELQAQPIEITFEIFDYLDSTDLTRLIKVSAGIAKVAIEYQEYRARKIMRGCLDEISRIQYRTGVTPLEYYGIPSGTNLQFEINVTQYITKRGEYPVEYSVRKIDKREVIMTYRSATSIQRDPARSGVKTTDILEITMNYETRHQKQKYTPNTTEMLGSDNRSCELYRALTGESCYYRREYNYRQTHSQFGFIC